MLIDLSQWTGWRSSDAVLQPMPATVIDLNAIAYERCLQQIKTDLREWHQALNERLRNGCLD